jgi:hypothetical protein
MAMALSMQESGGSRMQTRQLGGFDHRGESKSEPGSDSLPPNRGREMRSRSVKFTDLGHSARGIQLGHSFRFALQRAGALKITNLVISRVRQRSGHRFGQNPHPVGFWR